MKCSAAKGWATSTTIGIAAPQCHRNLEKLKLFLSPRVCSSAMRTIFNGWCTHRRFQQGTAGNNKCAFGCGCNAEDSIEHYCRCPAVLDVLRTQLRIIVTPQRAITFWTMAFNHSDDVVKCSALSSYAAYKMFNMYTELEVVLRALQRPSTL